MPIFPEVVLLLRVQVSPPLTTVPAGISAEKAEGGRYEFAAKADGNNSELSNKPAMIDSVNFLILFLQFVCGNLSRRGRRSNFVQMLLNNMIHMHIIF
jgi:hypothetical protein